MVLIRCMLAIVALAGAFAHSASAQNYPSRPIRLVVPFPPGGTADVVARILAQPVGQALGQALVVDNRAGADGAVAALLAMNAPPDGHTLFLASNSAMSAVPTMHRKPPYDPRTDFTSITMVGKFTFFLFINPAVPARTLAEFIDYARANPGKLNYGSGNTTAIVSMAQLSLLAKLDMTHVPYKGDAPTTADLIPAACNPHSWRRCPRSRWQRKASFASSPLCSLSAARWPRTCRRWPKRACRECRSHRGWDYSRPPDCRKTSRRASRASSTPRCAGRRS